MARTTKGAKSTKKNKAVESDYSFTIKADNESGQSCIDVDLYERDNGNVSAKITLAGCFVIYARVVNGKNGAFMSYPSFKNKNGDYINQAFCFDKDIIAEINAELEEYFNAE